MNPIRITEYGQLTPGSKGFKKGGFELLENFILSNVVDGTVPQELMGLSVKRGVGKVITAKNYVGVISLKDGTQIEILPKICGRLGCNADPGELDASKKAFLRMLRTVSDLSGKSFQNTGLETARMPLFEVFVRMFLDEVLEIVRRGLKRGYTPVSRNEPFMRGKLLVAQNIKENFAHAERFFVEHDEFNYDQPENRLIKATLGYLKSRSRDPRNGQDIRVLLSEMEEIPTSADIDGDLKKASVTERGNAYYRTALSWCAVFLRGETFTSFAGKDYATAILFPMDTLYERYVAKTLRKILPDGYRVHPQEKKYCLFEGSEKFRLIPDVVISRGGKSVILDTKWKILNSDPYKNFGISQGDMYQMYAYHREYGAHGENVRGVITLYPDIEGRPKEEPAFSIYRPGIGEDGVHGNEVRIRFLDLSDENKERESFERLAGEITGMI